MKNAELRDLKDRGHNLEAQISEVDELLKSSVEDKRTMEREKEIYETQMNNLKSEQNTLNVFRKG